ncbi:minor tail protein [Microbacterium phage Tempo]|nr:minor tail protein [Microbacterium phage Tempo]WNN94063.1 minor tail protein [Microbacterium phage Fregley]WNT44248.1 minor tail protein [Microbacterium phage CandC]
MVYEGYLRIGGVEVVNTERARGYTRTSPCPVWWIDDAVACPGLAEAVGDQPYTYENISEAPWYDRSLAALSSRFYGVVGLRIDGFSDSTRATSRTEGVTPGGSLGATRKGMRDVRVRATLIAEGLDALDYGSEWMSSAFDGGCGVHSSGCGLMDADVLTACPPVRGEVPDFTEWEETRRNLIANPAFRQNTATWSAAAGGGAVASIERQVAQPGLSIPTEHFARLTYTTTGTWFRAAANTDAVTPGQEYTLSAWLRGAPTAGNFRLFIQWKTSGGSLVAEVSSPNVNLGSSFSRASFTAVAPAGAAYATIQYGRASAQVGDFFDVAGALFEKSSTLQNYFDGETPATSNPVVQQRHSWVGTADASSSIEESRYSITRPRTPEEYALIINALRRYVHDVAVTSGPIVVATYKSKTGNFYSREVEFTITSERAWVYGMTKELTLAPSLPTVMEDTPYNRIPYPSAELGAGSIVIAKNLADNPSVEVNATNWSTTATVVSGSSPNPYLTGARSTELAAVGTASYRSRILGNGSTLVSGGAFLFAHNDVALPAGTGRRISLNMWAACLIAAGGSSTAIQSLQVRYDFLNGGTSIGGAVVFGTATTDELSGNAYSITGVAVPAAATAVRVSAVARVDWASSATGGQNSDIRLYADALTVSVP